MNDGANASGSDQPKASVPAPKEPENAAPDGAARYRCGACGNDYDAEDAGQDGKCRHCCRAPDGAASLAEPADERVRFDAWITEETDRLGNRLPTRLETWQARAALAAKPEPTAAIVTELAAMLMQPGDDEGHRAMYREQVVQVLMKCAAKPEPVSAPTLKPTESQMQVTDEMVSRFLCWRLPDNFTPDAGITFKPVYNESSPMGPSRHEPTGTNLLNAEQARAMLEHVIRAEPVSARPASEPRWRAFARQLIERGGPLVRGAYNDVPGQAGLVSPTSGSGSAVNVCACPSCGWKFIPGVPVDAAPDSQKGEVQP